MSREEHARAAAGSLGFAVVTVSDTRRGDDDHSGPLARRLVEEGGHRVVEALAVPDEAGAIGEAVTGLLGRDDVDVVVLTGGTGVSPRDVTPEAVAPLLELVLPGFGELLRMLSFEQVGAAAMMSRALAGVARGRAVFALPGSPNAVELAMARLVLPEAGHLVAQARRGAEAAAPRSGRVR
jgi:molybdenum cofactor biosynthesis protein B